MKVFKMNEMEHVAAKTAEEAKKFYGELCGFMYDEVQEEFEGEANLQNTMLVDVKDLPADELVRVGDLINQHGMTWVHKTFEWVLENDTSNNNEPFVICSME